MYEDRSFAIQIQKEGLITVYDLSNFTKKTENAEYLKEKGKRWSLRGVYTHLSQATVITIFKDTNINKFPRDSQGNLTNDIWFILADNTIYGFRVKADGSQIESAQMKYEVAVGTSETQPSSITLFKQEVNLR